MRWCSGSACIVDNGSILWQNFYFLSCGMYELIQHMNSYIRWNQYEFIYFCTLNIWIHTNMNSYMYEFIYFFSYHVWIHIFFAVQNKSCECTWATSMHCERAARAASAQHKLQACSASRKGEAQAHLLPQPGRAWLPQPLGLRAAAPIVRVACSCTDS